MVLVALALRLAVVPLLYQQQLDPQRDHWPFGYEAGRIARSIVQGRGFSSPLFAETGPTAWMPPVFPYILAGIFKVAGVYTAASAVLALSLNALLSALVCVPIFSFARRSFGERVGTWSGWAWAFFPYAIYFPADRIWETYLTTLLLSVLFLLTLQLEDSGGTGTWAGYGALWGMLALTSAVALSVMPALWGWICVRRHQKKMRWMGPIAAALLALLAVVLPWCVRNYRTFHQFIPLRDTLGLELRVGNNGETAHWFPRMIGPWHSETEWSEFQRAGEAAYMEEKKQQALEYIKSHPGWFLRVSARRALYLWTGYWSLSGEYLNRENLDPLNIPFCSAVTLLGLYGLWRALQQDAAAAFPYLLVLLFFPAIYYVTHPEVWYRRPIDPQVVVLAVYGLAERSSGWTIARRPRLSSRQTEQ
jgi:4-amino-4-deoxy-L-arabinose transferase-like glycosyltransferase